MDPIQSLPISYYQNLITSKYQSASPNFLQWAAALLGKLDDLSTVATLIPAAFDLDAAVGVQLDVIGERIGAARQLPFTPTGTTGGTMSGGTVTVVSTIFNEAAAGDPLIGTAPATGPSGVTWQGPDGSYNPFVFQAGGGVIGANPSSGPTNGPYIDLGVTDFDLDILIPNNGGNYSMLMIHYVDTANLMFVNMDSGSAQLYQYVNGVFTQLGGMGVTGGVYNLHVNVTGSSITIRDNSSSGNTMTGTIPSTNGIISGTKFGFTNEGGTNMTVASLTVTAQGGPTPTPVSSILGDDDYRTLIRARIGFNHWDGTVDGLQPIWRQIFPQGRIVIQDAQNMSATVILTGVFNNLVKQMIQNGMIVPRPAGVLYNYSFAALPVLGTDFNNEFIAGLDNGKFA